MIICHSKKFIFIHVNKCGGTSVTRSLYPFMAKDDLVLGSVPKQEKLSREYQKQFGIYKHSSAAAIRKFVGEDVWSSYYKFAVIRNPWEKILSTYFWFKKTQWGEEGKGKKVRDLSFDQYIRSIYLNEKSCTDLLYSGGELMVDNFFDISKLDQMMSHVCKRFELPPIALSKDNSTQHKHYSEYYKDKELIEIIARKYADDISNFGFSFSTADNSNTGKSRSFTRRGLDMLTTRFSK